MAARGEGENEARGGWGGRWGKKKINRRNAGMEKKEEGMGETEERIRDGRR